MRLASAKQETTEKEIRGEKKTIVQTIESQTQAACKRLIKKRNGRSFQGYKNQIGEGECFCPVLLK